MPSDPARPRGGAALALVSAAFLACAGMAGCGGTEAAERLPLVRASGIVTHRGRPAEGARVTLHPSEPAVAAAGLFPHGVADASGRFELTTYDVDDGAPAGEYRVTVTWPDAGFVPKSREQIEELHAGGQPPDRLRGRYASPDRSGLRATVRPGEDGQALPAIEPR